MGSKFSIGQYVKALAVDKEPDQWIEGPVTNPDPPNQGGIILVSGLRCYEEDAEIIPDKR